MSAATTIVGQVRLNQDCHVQLQCNIFQISRLEKETAAFKRQLEDIDNQLKSVTNEPDRFEIKMMMPVYYISTSFAGKYCTK